MEINWNQPLVLPLSLVPLQSQLAQLLMGTSSAGATADQINDIGSPLRKTFPNHPFSPMTPTTPGTSSNTQLTLGNINQQLSALSQQLSGLNQQTQNLQMHGANSSLLAGFNAQSAANKMNNDLLSQQDLFQLNQDLLSRLQQLNLGGGGGNNNNNINNTTNNMQSGSSSNSGPNSASPSSFIFTNPMNVGRPYTNATNSLFLGSSLADTGGGGSLTPSPLSGTLNRNSFTPSPAMLDNYEHLMANNGLNYEALQMQSDANNNASDGGGALIRPISQVGTLTTMDAAGKLKVIVPVKQSGNGNGGNVSPGILSNSDHGGMPFQLTPVLKRPEKKVTLSSASPSCSSSQTSSLRSDSNRSNPNMVTLKITDEEGHSHSPKRSSQPLSATPSFITRSTSEKVPNRSQMMQQVQRTAWARHTTK